MQHAITRARRGTRAKQCSADRRTINTYYDHVNQITRHKNLKNDLAMMIASGTLS
jgi:hypothetical protein